MHYRTREEARDDIFEYILFRRNEQSSYIVSTNLAQITTDFIDTTVERGQRYTYWLIAYVPGLGDSGTSTRINTVNSNILTMDVPGKQTLVYIDNGENGNTVLLKNNRSRILKNWIDQKSIFVESIISKMFIDEGNFEDRIDPEELESSIGRNLINNRIDLPFEFGLFRDL